MKILTLFTILSASCINAQEIPQTKQRDSIAAPKIFEYEGLDSLQLKTALNKNKMPIHTPNPATNYYMNVKKIHSTPNISLKEQSKNDSKLNPILPQYKKGKNEDKIPRTKTEK